MISTHLRECLSNRTGSYLIPLLWYTGESAELVRKEMDAIRQAGISEFIFENRGGTVDAAFRRNSAIRGRVSDARLAAG